MRRKRYVGWLLAIAALFAAPPARAEQLAPTPPSLDLAPDLASDLAPDLDLRRDSARRKFSEASALAKRAEWSLALALYRESFTLYPHAMTLFNVGFCLGETGDWLAALRVTTAALDGERFAADLSLRSERREMAEAQLLAIRAQLAELQFAGAEVLSVTVDGAGSTTLGGAGAAVHVAGGVPLAELAAYADPHASEPPRSLFVLPGPHRVAVQTRRGWQTFDVSPRAGEQQQLAVDATPLAPALAVPTTKPAQRPAPDRQRPVHWRRPAAFSALALGGAGLGLAAAIGVVARNADARLADACGPDLGCAPEQQATVDRYRRSMTWVNVGLITGVVGASAGVAILVLVPAKTQTALSVSPSNVTLTHAF